MKITLIGMSGVGKSLVGNELSKVLKYRFIDTDEIIERKHNLTLQKLIVEIGKERFLKLEEETVLDIGNTDDLVISTGGSVVYSEKAMSFLKRISKIVFLDAPLNEIKNRIQDFSNRGIIGLEDGLEKLFYERYQLYNKYADIKIQVEEKFDLKMILNNIIKNLYE